MNPIEKIIWEKYCENPVPSLAVKPGSWRADASMTVDLIEQENRYQIFYVGKTGGKDAIGIASCPKDRFDGISWEDYAKNPVVSPGEPGSYDSKHAVDPSALVHEGKVFLYYSALGDGPDSIGLAISEDGINFKKQEQPVLVGRAPEVVKTDGTIYLLYSMDSPKGGYEFHLATSTDGINFKAEGPVFTPDNTGWDSLSVVTPRILYKSGIYIMAYAGDDKEKDYPTHFGFAFSKDMRTWKRYAGNPVFSGGAEGTWESRAIWYPEVFPHQGKYYMWYEGHDGKRSQVGMAVSQSPIVEIGITTLGMG